MIWLLISSSLTLICSIFLISFLVRLVNWIYLTIFASKDYDLSVYGGSKVIEGPMRSPKSWALITGASDGIGAAFAIELTKQRFNIFLVGRNLEKLTKIQTEIEALETGIKVVCLLSEASEAEQENVENLFQQTEEHLKNGHSIRILINNVGMGQNGKRRLGNISVSEGGESGLFEEIVNVNCIYPVLLTRAFLKRLKVQQDVLVRYAIINVASCAALVPSSPFSSLYAATKSFNRSFSLSLSGELCARNLLDPEIAPPVDVICVNPGFVVSNMTKMKESMYCCTSADHAKIVFSKISKGNCGVFGVVDIIPHWKHGMMWSTLAALEVLIPSEWVLTAFIMPAVLKYSGKFRNFDIKDQ